MDALQAIAERHSYRGPFKEQRVPREDLETIARAGLAAPSGCNAQTPRLVIVDDLPVLRAVAELLPPRASIATAQAMIFVLIDRQADPTYEGHSFQVEDCAAAVENMLLAITALGYGSVWIDGYLRTERRAQQIAAMLGVPEDKQLRVLLPIGVPAEPTARRDKLPFEQRAWFNRYEG